MTLAETKEVIKLLGELFMGQVTESIAKMIREDLGEFPKQWVVDAIKEHRRTREMLNYPQLIEGVRAVQRREQGGQETTRNEGNLAAIFRRNERDKVGRLWLHDVQSDAEVIVRKYRNDWYLSSQSDGYRNGISMRCRSALMAVCSMDHAGADAWANPTNGAIFDPRPEIFKQFLDELRGARAAAVMSGQVNEQW